MTVMSDGSALIPSARLRRLLFRLKGRSLTVAEVAAQLGEDHVTPWLIMLLAIPALIPSPGLPVGVVVGIAIAFVALQMLIGSRSPHLPAWLGRREVRFTDMRRLIIRVRPWLRRLERWSHPHPTAFRHPQMIRALGVLVLINGVLIALPIPFGNTAPAIALLALAVGLIVHDGVMVTVGAALSLVALGLSVVLVGSVVWVVEAIR